MKNLIALATLAACGILHAQTAQTFASLKGVYSYTEEGVNATGQRYARIGVLELDGTGAALASDVTKTAGAPIVSRLSGAYQPAEDGSIEVKLYTTSTTAEDDLEVVTSTPHSSLKLIAAGQGTWEGLRTDAGVSGIVKVETRTTPTFTTARRYALIEDGLSTTPYSVLGTFEWSTAQSATASLLVKQSTLDSLSVSGTALLNPDGLATITLQSDSDADVSFRATYMGVPVHKGADWELVRVDAGILGSARLVAR